MLDKIRLHAKGNCLQIIATIWEGFDEKCVSFSASTTLAARQGGTDADILDWCFTVNRKPSEDDVYVWNEFMRKRGGTTKFRKW
jgi:gluconokinase